MRPERKQILLGVGLILLTLLAYAPALNAGFIWDDDAYVTNSKDVKDVQHGLRKIWLEPRSVPQYYPLSHTVFWLEYRILSDKHPEGYHLLNILLHGISVVLVWVILRRLRVPGALLAAAIFAVHPVEVESVAWITELKNCLSGVFYFGAMLAYLRFSEPLDEPPEPTEPQPRRWRLYFLSLAMFIISMLAKTVTATLPGALLLILWWKRPRLRWRDIWPVLPMLALGAGMGLMTAWVEKHYTGAGGSYSALPLLNRAFIAGQDLWFYAGKIFWPLDIMFYYPRWVINTHSLRQLAYPVAAAGLVAGLAGLWLLEHFGVLKPRLGKGPLAAVLFFGGTLFPALGFGDIYFFMYSYVADHFQYLASLGLITLAAATLEVARRRFFPDAVAAGRQAAVVLVTVLAAMTFTRTFAYYDLVSLYEDSIDRNPRAWMAENNLANIMLREGDVERADELLTASVKYNNRNDRAWNNLGEVRRREGRINEAIQCYYTSLKLRLRDSGTNRQLGQLLVKRNKGNDLEAAAVCFRNILNLEPKNLDAANELGKILIRQGKADDAVGLFKQMTKRMPKDPAAHAALAGALAAAKHPDEARGEYETAAEEYRQQLKSNPGDHQAKSGLADVTTAIGKLPPH